MANAFGLDMGFHDNTSDEQEGLRVITFPASAQYVNSQKNNENRAYLFTTMCLNALLQDDRAPHEMMISQTLKSHVASRAVIDFCAMLGICISVRGLYDREEIIVRNRKDDSLVPPDLSVVAIAWDSDVMKPTKNFVGRDYVPFCVASSVGDQEQDTETEFQDKMDGLEGPQDEGDYGRPTP